MEPTTFPKSWSDRTAPRPLLLVQEFLNTALDEPTEDDLRAAEAMRRDAAAGESQATVAARYGVSRQLVSAILRGKRIAGAEGEGGGVVAAATFGSVAGMTAWLRARGFEGVVGEAQRKRIVELHGLLIALCLANNGEDLVPGTLTALDRIAATVPLIARFDGAAPTLATVGGGFDAFVGAALAAVYDGMRDGSWARLKACPADRCHHAFYDTSRNRTSMWCSMAICGNRAKVRGYQERVRSARQR